MVRRCLLVWLAWMLPAWAQQAAKPLVIVLIGPPGSGKTTQAAFLNPRYKLPVIARDHLAKIAPTAIDTALRTGVRELEHRRGFVLDGYPATRAEADYLAALVKELKLPDPLVIQLDVPDEEVRARLKKRGLPEDTPAKVEAGLARYKSELSLVRSYYPKADIWTIDGTRAPSGVSATIESLIAGR